MKWIPVFLLLLTGTSASAHPLHLSVTNITVQDKEIVISMKTFRDDWETAYFHFHSRVIDFSDPRKREIPWFLTYLDQAFRISLTPDSPPLELKVDTITVSEDNMMIEMHGDMQEEPNSLYIYNALLTDIFPDQTNLVMIGLNNRETGIKFDIKKHSEEISLR